MQRGAVNGTQFTAATDNLTSAADNPTSAATSPLRSATTDFIFQNFDHLDLNQAETPMPDYEEEYAARAQRRSSLNFVNNFQNIILNIRSIDELYSCFPEPDPDYINDDDEDNHELDDSDFPPPPPVLTSEELSAAVSEAYDMHVSNGTSMTSDDISTSGSDALLIKPKPLHNPCLESRERLALHRELLMNYKIGKDVLQKPELNKVLRERRERERKKEWDEQKSSKSRTSLVVKLEERANRLKEEEEKKIKAVTDEAEAPELARVHRKITQRSGSSEQI